MSKQRIYICYWDDNGFEIIKDVSDWERNMTLATLKGTGDAGGGPNFPVSLPAIMARARLNGHRSPHIYTFSTDHHITEDTLWEIANDDPQMLSSLIAENGEKVF